MTFIVTKTFLSGALTGLTINEESPVSFEIGKIYGGGWTGPQYKVVGCAIKKAT